MFAAFFASVLSFQAAAHGSGRCSCREPVVTSYTATVIGPSDGWGGSLPNVRFVPGRIEFRPCVHARRRAR